MTETPVTVTEPQSPGAVQVTGLLEICLFARLPIPDTEFLLENPFLRTSPKSLSTLMPAAARAGGWSGVECHRSGAGVCTPAFPEQGRQRPRC